MPFEFNEDEDQMNETVTKVIVLSKVDNNNR